MFQINARDYDSLRPGDVVEIDSRLNQLIAGSKSIIIGWYKMHGGPVVRGTLCTTAMGRRIRSGNYAGQYQIHWWNREVTRIISRGSEYYRRKPKIINDSEP